MRDTPGRNYIVGQGRSPSSGNFSISDSRFINGGTSLPGNDNQNDFSALFFTNPNVHVDRVTITHDNEPFQLQRRHRAARNRAISHQQHHREKLAGGLCGADLRGRHA